VFQEAVQLGQAPGDHLGGFGLVPGQAPGVEILGQDHVGVVVHVAGGGGETAQHGEAPGPVPHLFHDLSPGGLFRALARLDAPLGQGQLVAFHPGGVFADEQHGVLVQEGDHQDRAVRRALEAFVLHLHPVGKAQVQRLHVEDARAGQGPAAQDAGCVAGIFGVHGGLPGEGPF